MEIENNVVVPTPVVTDVKTSEVKTEVEDKSKEIVKEEPIKVDRNTARLAQVAKKEAELFRRERDLKAKESNSQDANKIIEEYKANPYQFNKKYGVNFDDLLDAHLSEISKTPEKESKKDPEWKKVEDRLEAFEKKEKEREAKLAEEQYKTVWANHLNDVKTFIAKPENAEKYEVILSNNDKATELYVDLVRSAIKEIGRDLNDEEFIACLDRTEELLTDEIKVLLEKNSKSKKFGSLLSQPIKIEPEIEKKSQETVTKTLSNSLATASSAVKTSNNIQSKNLWEEQAEKIKLKYLKK